MKKIIIISVIAIIFVFSILGLYPYLVAYNETSYANNFDKNSFNNISIGMELEEVKELLAEPITIIENDDLVIFVYSESPNSTHFFKKEIFFTNSKVVKKIDELYFD